ncbi:uncharacterized protein LOC119074449 [Bradysia coprophila]|uniref:uncharacterized protein LOC119074449 n=1 Tax=Bradysia coprophila TaxID=38358 RepID=UPI00187DA8CF|nr:uncharacterized protein LOC119074449 [Bradysia coprophila]
MIYGKVWAMLIVFAVYLMQDTTALKCWKCASDATATKFCGKNLDKSNLTENQIKDSYVECKNNHNSAQLKAKGDEVVHRCEVYKQIINNFEEVYIRGCTLETKNAPTDKCLSAYSDTAYVKTVQCKTCFTDGCNEILDSASIGVKISKVVVVSLIVLAVLLV